MCSVKVAIYYMSGTGNTRRAAELVQLQLRALGQACEVINWTREEFQGWASADAFGFATPTHSYREPTPFKKRLQALPSVPANTRMPVFLIAGCAGEDGNVFARVGKRLRQKGAAVVGCHVYVAPFNVLTWPEWMTRINANSNAVQDQLVLQFARTLPELLTEGTNLSLHKRLMYSIVAAIAWDPLVRRFLLGKLDVDETKCVQCGKCTDGCMAQCIYLDPFPRFDRKRCVSCMGCVNLCPNDAIDSKKTWKKPRYRGFGPIMLQPLP